jgi:integrase
MDKSSNERKYLTPSEIDRILNWLKKHKTVRDYCLVLLSYKHGLRASEACNLQWSDVSYKDRTLYIHRLKGSKSGYHPLSEHELRTLTRLKNFYLKRGWYGPYLFLNFKTKLAITRFTFNELCDEISAAKIVPVKVYPHIFRHSCGYYLANSGYDTRLIQDYLGHRNINCTQVYTTVAEHRFRSIQWAY